METKLEILKHELSIGNSDNLENALQDRTVKPEDRVGKDGFTLIHWACYYGMQEALQTLMLYDGAVNALETHGWTPAHICAIQGRDNCLQILLKYGANIHIEDSKGYTSGHLASAHGNTYTLRTILDTGYNLEAKDHRKWTAVHHAAFHGRYGVLQLLAKKGANLMSADKEGNIAAHLAAGEGHIDCLRLLVYYENDPLQVINSYNDRGATPKDLSIQFQKQHCADFLASAKSEAELDEEEEDDDGGIKAAYEGNLQLLSMLVLEGHCNVNHTDKYGSTPAHKAAGSGHADCLQWLIDHGADVTLQNNMKETPLDVAKKFAQIECIKLLGQTLIMKYCRSLLIGGKHFDTEEEDQQVDPLQSMGKAD
jgi:ankyrin repeat domain-containing protein 42